MKAKDLQRFAMGITACAFIAIAGPVSALAQGVLATVPWAGNPNQPHQVYSGGSVILQGTYLDANGAGINVTSATWDPGDGSAPVSVGTNGRAIELTHAYTGAANQPYTATLTVVHGSNTYTDDFKVVILPKTLDVEMNMGIDKGLWYLHKRMTFNTVNGVPGGRWSSSYGGGHIAATAAAVQAFQANNHRQIGDPNENPYVLNVARGLAFLTSTSSISAISIGVQTGGNPDTNGNNIGLQAVTNVVYIGGQIVDALVASGTPNATAVTGDANWVFGRTFFDIVQDLMDGYSYGQNDSSATGSWVYGWSNNRGQRADNSSAQWAAIGGLAGEDVWGAVTPAWVKSLNETRVRATQGGNGMFGYSRAVDCHFTNCIATTPSGLVQLTWDGVPRTDAAWVAGENLTKNLMLGANHPVLLNHTYATYAMFKAMRLAKDVNGDPDPVELLGGTVDWYRGEDSQGEPRGVARQILNVQGANGYMPTSSGWANSDLAHSWNVLMLSPTLFELGPVAQCSANPLIDGTAELGGSITFSGAGSSHQDPEGSIASYDWDFDDGSSGSGVSTDHAFASVGDYTVTLTTTDTEGNQNSSTCIVDVRETNIPPSANAGGPYDLCYGGPLILDGSGSRNLGDDLNLVSWEWDLTAPVFNTVDATGETVSIDTSVLFPGPGTYDIGLRVTNNADPAETATDFTTITMIPADSPGCNTVAVAKDDSAETDEDVGVVVEVLLNDDGDAPLTITAASDPTNGSATIQGGSILYTPNANFNGTDSFTYSIEDEDGETDSATVDVTVNPVNDPPVAVVQGLVQNLLPFACSVGWDINNGSFDLDGVEDIASIVISPVGPYPIGTTLVTLTITDQAGATDSAEATVTLSDVTGPVTTLSSPPAWSNTSVTVDVGAADDCATSGSIITVVLTGAQVGSSTMTDDGSVVVTAEGTTIVTAQAVDIYGNPGAPVSVEVKIDLTAPEFKNVFNPETLTVDVLALDDGSGVTSDPIVAVCVPTSWGSGKASAKASGKGSVKGPNAELCTYTVTDAAGNTTVLVEKRKTTGSNASAKSSSKKGSSKGGGGGEIMIEVVSVQYNGGDVIAFPPKADKKFKWSLNSDGSLKELEQKMELGKGNTKSQVTAHYSSKKGTTEINVHGGDGKLIGDDLRLLCMTSNEGELEITFDPAGLTLKNSVKSSVKAESTKASKKVSEKASGKPSKKSSSKGKG